MLIFAGLYLRDQWAQLQQAALSINWGVMAVAQLGMFAGLAALPVVLWLTLEILGHRLPLLTVCSIFFLSNLAKYLPGSIWALPGRAFLYQRAGLTAAVSVGAVFWEVLLIVLTTAGLSLLAAGYVAHYIGLPLTLVGVALAGVVFTGLLIVLVRGNPARIPVLNRVATQLHGLRLKWQQIMKIIAAYMVAWSIIGLAFALMIYAITPDFESGWWLELVGIYAGTWLVGFLVIIAPGGIGVRDVLIALALSLIAPAPIPVLAAVLARILWTVAELVGFGLSAIAYAATQEKLKPKPE